MSRDARSVIIIMAIMGWVLNLLIFDEPVNWEASDISFKTAVVMSLIPFMLWANFWLLRFR